MTPDNHAKDTEGSQPTGSWGRFAGRIYFDPRYNPEEDRTVDTVWLYVAISAVYFFLIGMLLVILLLAPKITPKHSETSGGNIVTETILPPEISLAEESEVITDRENTESFVAAPRDPLYDIDPRSPIFRGDNNHRSKEDANDGRLRFNSKFLQD